MSPITTGIVGIIVLLAFMAVGMRIGLAMLLIGFVGFTYLTAFKAAIAVLARVPFEVISNYDFCVLPLFLLMASICLSSGLARSLFRLVNAWIGRLNGGLSAATIGACALFAAASASSIATAVTMGTVAIPEMKNYKYDASLATGCVAAGGTLGILIPPSGILILYGVITEQSISDLFTAGVIPGFTLALLFIVMIVVRASRNPKLAPKGPKTSFKEKMLATADSIEMVALLMLVIIGLIIGWFTPTEAGAIGAFGAILFSLIRRRLSWQGFKEAAGDSIRNTGMIFTIIIGAYIFNAFLAVSTVPMELASWVSTLGFSPILIMVLIIFAYMVLGCFIDAMSMIVLTIPIFYPVVISLGFDPIWFGIIIVLVTEMAMITPPVGMNVYVIAGVARDVPMQTIFRGILPFVLIEIFFIALVVAFPQIVLFLPSLGN